MEVGFLHHLMGRLRSAFQTQSRHQTKESMRSTIITRGIKVEEDYTDSSSEVHAKCIAAYIRFGFFLRERSYLIPNKILFVTMHVKGIASYFSWPKNLYFRSIGLCNSDVDGNLYVFIYISLLIKKMNVNISEQR